MIRTSSEIEDLAAQVIDTEGVVFVPSLTGLGAPYWNPEARGMLMGITRGTKTSHIARAALEGIAFQVADIIELVQLDLEISELRVDGGAAKDSLLMKIQADLLDIPLIRPKWSEVTALGATFLAGLAIGYWKSQEEIKKLWSEQHRFEPSLSEEEVLKKKKAWQKAIQCTQMWGQQ